MERRLERALIVSLVSRPGYSPANRLPARTEKKFGEQSEPKSEKEF